MVETLFLIVLSLMAVFLILLVLVQRGRGGGLAGAFGGAGGSSAFGAKAGDTFTRVTIWAASIWIVTCILASYWAGGDRGPLADSDSGARRPAATDSEDAGMGAASDEGAAADSEPATETDDEDAPALDAPGADSGDTEEDGE